MTCASVARSGSNGLSVGFDAERCSPRCRETGLALESMEERGGAAAGNPGSGWLHSLIQDLGGATGRDVWRCACSNSSRKSSE